MALSGFETFSRVLFGWLGRLLTKDSVGLKNQLVKARIPLLPEDYVATSIMQIITAFLVGLGITLGLLLFLIPDVIETLPKAGGAEGETLEVSRTVELIIAVFLCLIIPLMIALVQWLAPALQESSRASNMDRQLPFAASYVSAMAAANATPVSYTHLTLPTICSV